MAQFALRATLTFVPTGNLYPQKDLHAVQLHTYVYLSVIALVSHVGGAPTSFMLVILLCVLFDRTTAYLALCRGGIWTYIDRCELTIAACAAFIAVTYTEVWHLWCASCMLTFSVAVSVWRLTRKEPPGTPPDVGETEPRTAVATPAILVSPEAIHAFGKAVLASFPQANISPNTNKETK